MKSKLKVDKVFRDPIHGYIHFDNLDIYKLVESKEMQRLKRIYQLGGSFQVFPTAEHSRFSHSIGAYQIATRIIDEVSGIRQALSELDQFVLKIAVLLHDLGHGPFSHAFEMIHKTKHEEYTKAIISGNSEINKLLKSMNPDLPTLLCQVYDGVYKNKIVNQLVSSQLDADRMDYLLRDAYFCGTPYGSFDIGRILRVMLVNNGKIVFKESGIPAIEDYLVGRYHMYKQVYLHPRSLSFELILVSMIKRFIDLSKNNYKFKFNYEQIKCLIPNKKIVAEDYHELDDNLIYFYAKQMLKEKDSILVELADRFINRKLLDHVEVNSQKQADAIEKQVIKKGFDPRYFVYKEHLIAEVYKKYGTKNNHEILILDKNAKVASLIKASSIVAALDDEAQLKSDQYLVFYKS
jgi:HD superfamily phosphohydrolase